MVKPGPVVAPLPGCFEQQLKVLALPRVDDIQHDVGVQFPDPILDRGQIRRRIGVGAVCLANDERSVVAFMKNADRAVTFRREPAFRQVLHDIRQHRLIETLTQRPVESDSQFVIDSIQRFETLRQELVPQSPILFVARVQFRCFCSRSDSDSRVLRGKFLEDGA